MKRTGRSLAELASGMPQFPQVMVNVKVRERIDPAGSPAIQGHVQRVEAALGTRGRVVLRASGTEPLIRVMVEGEDEALVKQHAEELAETVRQSV
jgi:phosphoglucosamine mutase